MTDKVVILSTCNSRQQADEIARSLVEKRLAACVNVGPAIRSTYRWQGKLEQETEYPLLIKSRRDLFKPLQEELERIHSYDVPEVMTLPVVEGSDAYMGWMDRELAE